VSRGVVGGRGPAYRVQTERLVLRCWEPTDAPRLSEAIERSLDHLRPWMPWAHHEPEPLDDKVQRLRRFRADFDGDRDYIYAILDASGTEVLGGTGLHPRIGEGGRELGYWIHAEHVRRGYATEAAAALTRVAFEVDGMRRVEIRCDPANVPSAAVPARIGFTHEATLRHHSLSVDGAPRDTMIWGLAAADFPRTPAASTALEAYDALGRRIL
jgi:RimJ/RimL family protein N-acetyltransferase